MVKDQTQITSVSDTAGETNFGQSRAQLYWLIGLGLTIGYLSVRGVQWLGSGQLHTIMEVASTLLALIVGGTALVRYYADRNLLFLFVGAGFLGTAFFDGYHAAITSSFFAVYMPSGLSSLIPWSWLASRQFLALFLFLSWVAWVKESRRTESCPAEPLVRPTQIYMLTALLVVISSLFFAFVPLPRAYFAQLPFPRPEEFFPALLFAVTLIGYLRKGTWQTNAFEHWLVLALVTNVVAQVCVMPFSGILFDLEFDLAHLLKLASYICVFAGLLTSLRRTYGRLENQKIKLVQTKSELEHVVERMKLHGTAIDEHAIVSIADNKGFITYVNDQFCTISGYSREELIGQDHRIVGSGEHDKAFFAGLWKTISSGKIWHGVIQNKAKGGTPYWVKSTILPAPKAEGGGIEYISLRTDITAHKDTEIKLRDNWDLLMTTFESFPGGLAVFDEDLNLIQANVEYFHQFGLPLHKVQRGTPYKDILKLLIKKGCFGKGATDDIIEKRYRKIQNNNHGMEELTMPGGQVLDVRSAPLDDGGILFSSIDISQQRAREEKLSDIQQDLNGRIYELEDTKQRFEAQAEDQVELTEQLSIAQSEIEIALARAEASEEEFRMLAHHDHLTGLANRALFNKRLHDAVLQSHRAKPSGLLLLDLDKFKEINDTLGHPTGDVLLKEVAERLKEVARETDVIARLGGDEFAVIALNLDDADDMRVIAQKLVDALAKPFEIMGETIYTGTSIGLAEIKGGDNDLELVYKQADMALYLAKSEGRGIWRHFDGALNAELIQRQEVEQVLRQSLASESLRLYCQPQIHMETNEVVGVEFVPAWQCPNKGWVLGREFMRSLEATDLIVEICEWTFKNACKQVAVWQSEGAHMLQASVRVPMIQLQKPGFEKRAQEVCTNAGVSPSWVELQIMDSAKPAIRSQSVQDALHGLKAAGFKLTLADLGTGYCSFEDMQNFPLDRVKIHRSFVAQICTRKQTWVIAQMLINMAESMDVDVLADGIENEDQFAKLALNGCMVAQGPFVGNPLNPEDFETLAFSNKPALLQNPSKLG